jgi:hypothetical protein
VAGEKQGKPDSRGLSFFDITDFSAGIYDNSLISAGTAPNLVPGLFPAPPGAADVSDTYGCMSLPNGGLGPLPALGGAPGSGGLSLNNMGISTAGRAADITALANSFQTFGDELVIGITLPPSGGFQTTTFYSYQVGVGASSLQTIQSATYNFGTNLKNFCAYPFTSLMTGGERPAQPVLCLPLTAPDGPTSALLVYPSIAAPSAYGTDTIAPVAGTAFGHQGRLVALQSLSYSWPTGISIYPNEAFNYTDPPQTETWPHQYEIFGPEAPFGYGGINSVSAGELFCIKRRNGAIIIQGDLNNPTVTQLPGVQSTGNFYGRTDTDQNGMYYCSLNHGAWLWGGGNSSQKISNQLDNNFFATFNPITDTVAYGYYCQRWGDWMLFSNNWIYDSLKGSWWRLDNPATAASYFWYVSGFSPNYMFAAPQSVPADYDSFLYEYDLTIPRASFMWQSLPIKLPSEDRVSTIRELVIRASNPYGDAVPVVSALLIDDKGDLTYLDPWSMTTGIGTIQETRLQAGTKQTTTVAIQLFVHGTTYAPVIHSLGIGYRTREHVAIT